MTTENRTIRPEEIEWVGIYNINWFPLNDTQVKGWEDQIRYGVPGIKKGEITAALLHFASIPCEDKRDRLAPRPRQVVEWILSKRKSVQQDTGIGRTEEEQHRQEVYALANEGKWQELSDYLFALNAEEGTRLNIEVERLYPQYQVVWSDEMCEDYERLYGKICPYWRKDRAPQKPLAMEPGLLSIAPVNREPQEAVSDLVYGAEF